MSRAIQPLHSDTDQLFHASYVNIVAGDGHNTSFAQSGGQGPSNTAIWFVEATGQIKAVWRDEANTGSEGPIVTKFGDSVHH